MGDLASVSLDSKVIQKNLTSKACVWQGTDYQFLQKVVFDMWDSYLVLTLFINMERRFEAQFLTWLNQNNGNTQRLWQGSLKISRSCTFFFEL